MKLEHIPLKGSVLQLQPFAPDLKEEVRAAVDCDPETWAIMPVNPMGDGFDLYWSAACGAPPGERMAYAIRRRSDNRVIGMSTFYTSLVGQGGVSIGTSFIHPSVRGGAANPAAKLLMLDHAFKCGAVRVSVDTRNKRSQAAVAKLGATREGVLRRDRLTWTGYIRDTVVFSILDQEWPELKARLQARVEGLIKADLTKL